ncbi:polyisoprenoid-binding protein [Roseibium denhamense]|uniref:Polyisoprenoid-binding protein YceI n=1 Tax=Roseibium denhamense TaxID=76305 RepID=A0ABY1N6M0_9HYPH|nr:YceI family protein [Roseibium denhamense]MTI04372.1 polyisoprenoid-binding protein [Roseibium denhamense]SMP00816.1 Polyisoprenoid-binding protein YceI [Roseibium denhamense]
MSRFNSLRAALSPRPVARALALLSFLFALAAPVHAGSLTGTYSLVPAQIDTGFSVRVLGGKPVLGGFKNVSGKIILNEAAPEKSRVNVKVDLTTVHTPNDRITGFLKSSAMFDVANHPVATFQSTRVRVLSGNAAEVDGVLTLRGKQQRTKLTVTINGTGNAVSFEVSGGFFRSRYGMDAGLPLYADKVNLNIKGKGRRS